MSVIIDDLYFKISWRVSTSLKARQFDHIQWDSLKNKNQWNIHIQTTPLNSQARQRRGRRDWNISLRQGHPTPYPTPPPKCIENTFSLIQSTFKSLEMHSKRRYKSCICLVVLGQLESFRNYLGPQYYFSENFRCNFRFYESENFSDSYLHRIFESENFRFPFSTKHRLTWGLKCEKLNFRKS